MALINGNDYDHIDFTKNGVTTRHMLKDTLSRQMSGDLVKVQNEEPTSEGTKIWIKPSGDSEVQVPTYEEFEELSDKIDDADATIESLAVGAQPTVSVTEVDGHKRFSFGIPASNGIASITKTATDGVIDTYTIAMTDGTSTSFSVNNSDITPESMAETIATALQDYARIDGYYPDLTAGNADQLNSTKFVENKEPYLYRPSGGTSDIGNRKYLDAVVGGTLAWNQAVRDEASENETDFAPIVTVTDAVEDVAGVRVKIEPVQDLHGYDHPWPGGGNRNLLDLGGQYTIAQAGSVVPTTELTKPIPAGTYTAAIKSSGAIAWQVIFTDSNGNSVGSFASNGNNAGRQSKTGTLTDTAYNVRIYVNGGTTISEIQFESGSTATDYVPYANICPITGWDGVKVTRTGKNLFDVNHAALHPSISISDGELHMASVAWMSIWIANRIVPLDSKTGQQYTLSAQIKSETANNVGIAVIYTDGTIAYGNRSDVAGSYFLSKLTTDATKTVSGFGLSYNATAVTTDIKEIQLELGSTATDFEPYAGNTYDITLPTEAGTVYGGELTVNADGSGSLVVDRGIYIPQSTDGMQIYNYQGNHGVSFINSLPNALNRANGLCSHSGNVGLYFDSNSVWLGVNSTYIYWIGIFDVLGISTIEEFKNWLDTQTVQFVYPLTTPQTYTLTASQIRTLLGQNNVWADTGDLSLTYTGTDEHLVLESGKKYLSRISGTDSMLLGSGQEITAAKGTDNVFDLTQMFGTAVADYVYGQGAGFFRKWFSKQWYPYNTGELLSVEGLQSHDMVGFNQWDEEWENGTYHTTTGQKLTIRRQIRCKNPIPLICGAQYYAIGINWVGFYDENLNIVESPEVGFTPTRSDNAVLFNMAGQAFTVPNNAKFMWFYQLATYGATYKHNICLSLAHNGSRNGEYEPYEKHSYPLDSSVILRGIPKVGANGVYWDGDRYLPDGTVERKYGVLVCDGTVDYSTPNIIGDYSRIQVNFTGGAGKETYPQAVSSWLDKVVHYALESDHFYCNGAGAVIIVKTSKIGATGESVKAYFSAHPLIIVYELATPTTETAQPYHSTQWVSDWGTEEFVSTSIIPVGHETRYPANLRDKLQHLPDAASGNGSYLITQTDGQMVLTPFPAPPSTAGNYVLKATVVNGVATYTWEVAT